MKKAKNGIIFLILLFIPLTAHASEGKSSLRILPLDEENPRIYEVNNLDFGKQNQGASNQDFTAAQDLVIKIYDQRQLSSSWSLQLKISNFENQQVDTLPLANFSLGSGVVQTDNKDGLIAQNYSYQNGKDYQTILTSQAEHSRGWLEYRIPKEEITLSFSENAAIGKYQATYYWRIINADT
ncbi:WxL domain-containing protein [Enterococcus sp. LJL120]